MQEIFIVGAGKIGKGFLGEVYQMCIRDSHQPANHVLRNSAHSAAASQRSEGRSLDGAEG